MTNSELITIRYPSGKTEYRFRASAPAVGDVLPYDGGEWIVEEVAEVANGAITVTLRPSSIPGRLEGLPTRRASMLDDLQHRRAAGVHDQAADLHDDAVRLHAEYAEHMTAAGEPDKAARAARLAKKERDLAAWERARADQHKPASSD